jgi:hypothetical protein
VSLSPLKQLAKGYVLRGHIQVRIGNTQAWYAVFDLEDIDAPLPKIGKAQLVNKMPQLVNK